MIAAILFKMMKRKPWEVFSLNSLCTVYFYIILVDGLENESCVDDIAISITTLVHNVIWDCKL